MSTRTPAPAVVYLLADHLDTALAAGEDLLKTTLPWNTGDARAEDLPEMRRVEREAIESARALEMVLVARILKSRESALELANADVRFKPLARLYASTTEIVADAAEELTDETVHAFDAGGEVTGYLRERGLIDDDAPAPLEAATLQITEHFRIAGRMPLGALLDLVAMFLDTLESHYELYEDAEGAAAPRRSSTRLTV
jgi:hypothetical protein